MSASQTARAGALLAAGDLVVFPTETVYGLGASAVDARAVDAIFVAKGRPADNPLIVHLADRRDLLAAIPPDLTAARRAAQLTPGPLTVVIPSPAWVAPPVRAGLDTVALRVPAHPVARAIIAAAGVPVAAPSANRSGRPSPTTMSMAWEEMAGRVAAVIDGGDTTIGIESTVIDATEPDRVRILRPGTITERELRDAGITVEEGAPAHHERSPGTRHRHYRPSMPVVACEGASLHDVVASRLTGASSPDRPVRVLLGPGGLTAGAAVSSDAAVPGEDRRVTVVVMRDWDEYARRLYREFWEAEQAGAAVVFAEMPPAAEAPGLADRLSRAAEERSAR